MATKKNATFTLTFENVPLRVFISRSRVPRLENYFDVVENKRICRDIGLTNRHLLHVSVMTPFDKKLHYKTELGGIRLRCDSEHCCIWKKPEKKRGKKDHLIPGDLYSDKIYLIRVSVQRLFESRAIFPDFFDSRHRNAQGISKVIIEITFRIMNCRTLHNNLAFNFEVRQSIKWKQHDVVGFEDRHLPCCIKEKRDKYKNTIKRFSKMTGQRLEGVFSIIVSYLNLADLETIKHPSHASDGLMPPPTLRQAMMRDYWGLNENGGIRDYTMLKRNLRSIRESTKRQRKK